MKRILLGTAIALALSAPAFSADKDVLARVNGQDITRADLSAFEEKLPPGAKALPAPILEPMALDQIVNDRLLTKAAADAKIADSKEYKDRLAQIQTQLARETFLNQKIEKKITDSALRDAYDDYKKANGDQKEYQARHMLVDTEDQAKALITQLDKGADFAKLASQNNKGPEKEKGGELGYFSPKEVVPEFAEAVEKLKVGKYTEEPVKTQFGWHVIKLEDKRNRPVPKFEQVKDQLKQQLTQKLAQEEIVKLRKDANVQVFTDNLAQMPKAAPASDKKPDDKSQN